MKKAIKLVNSGSIIIYSTCSIIKEENERILESVKDNIEIIPIKEIESEHLTFLTSKIGTLTICPNEYYEGFFIAKLRKK